jgi:hypothetical protein
MSVKKSNIIVSIIIVVACVGALFGLSYQAPTTTILTESEYPTYIGYAVFTVSNYYYSYSSSYGYQNIEKLCAEWGYPEKMVCFVGNPEIALAEAENVCVAVSLQNTGSCSVVDEGGSAGGITAIASYTTSTRTVFYSIGRTESSTTILFSTLSTNAPIYMLAFRITQNDFTNLALIVTIAAVALAIIIAYPKKSGESS